LWLIYVVSTHQNNFIITNASEPKMFTPENPLESSLMKAATDPAHRPQFLRDFLASTILFIQTGDAPTLAEQPLGPGDPLNILQITHNDAPFLPIFSSLTRITDVVHHPIHYAKLPTKLFLEITTGASLILNPNSNYGKEFFPSEVATLLDGSIFQPTQSFTTTQPTQVLLGQPARYPQELADTLARLFATKPEVNAAYLAHFSNPAQHEKPHTLIALSVSANYDTIVADAGIIAQSLIIPDPNAIHIRRSVQMVIVG
jgi:hypothetical protein